MTKQEVTATQLGAIGENLVANQLIIASGGRLSPFRPVADDGGIDLLIHDKHTGRAAPLQVKTRTRTLTRHPKNVHFQIREATFREHREGFLLAVLFDGSTLDIRRAWLVPMAVLPSLARKAAAKLVIRPSIDMSPTTVTASTAARGW